MSLTLVLVGAAASIVAFLSADVPGSEALAALGIVAVFLAILLGEDK